MVSMQKVFFFPFLKAIFQQLETWLVDSFPPPSLKNLIISTTFTEKKKKNCSEYLQCSFILSLKNKNLLFYFIFTDNLSLLVKMDATHLCFSLPFMSGIPWIAKPDKVVHCRVFQLPPSTAPPHPVMGRTEASVVAFVARAGRQVSEPSGRRPSWTLLSPGVLLQSISNSQVSFFLKNNY